MTDKFDGYISLAEARAKRDKKQRATKEDAEQAIQRLSQLSTGEYELARRDEATRLGFRPTILDQLVKQERNDGADDTGSGTPLQLEEIEPWPEPVDGDALLDDIVSSIRRYIALSAECAYAVALWVIFAHAIDCFFISPRLGIISPEKRCGKTSLLTFIAMLVPRALHIANITSAALFRTVELARPTILADEADTFMKKSDELRGIINSGHNRGSAYVVRSVGEDNEPKKFSTWGALVIALIGWLADTLEDRSIVIQMRRKRPDEYTKRLRSDRPGELKDLGRQIARWVSDNDAALRVADPEVPSQLHDRAADNWRPLFAIADQVGGEWSERARAAAITLSSVNEDDADSIRTKLLADIRPLFEGVDKLSSKEICDALVQLEDRPWPEDKYGKPITPVKLSRHLSHFGIKPRNMKMPSGQVRKGYYRDDFEDTWGRYLPTRNATPLPGNDFNDLEQFQNATDVSVVADENGRKPAENRQSSGVADEYPGNGGEWEERAAIAEYDGGLSREEAEKLASDELPDLPSFLDRRGQH